MEMSDLTVVVLGALAGAVLWYLKELFIKIRDHRTFMKEWRK